MKRRCPARGCGIVIPSTLVACRRHWFSVPRELREGIWKLVATEPGSAAHRKAVFAAVQFLNKEPNK